MCDITSTTGPGCLGASSEGHYETTISPGTLAWWDFHNPIIDNNNSNIGTYGGEDILGSCRFGCTGVGLGPDGICPSTPPLVFEEVSSQNENLECRNLNYTSDSNTCQELASLTCQNTIDIQRYFVSIYWRPGDAEPVVRPDYQFGGWNWNADHTGVLYFGDTHVTFESMTDANGKELNIQQTLLEMAMQQLIEKNNTAPVKK